MSPRGALFDFGYTDRDLISSHVYLFLQLWLPPTLSEYKELRKLFAGWIAGKSASFCVNGKRAERFAKFFGFVDSGKTTVGGKIYEGIF
jgi:hypothetical protein